MCVFASSALYIPQVFAEYSLQVSVKRLNNVNTTCVLGSNYDLSVGVDTDTSVCSDFFAKDMIYAGPLHGNLSRKNRRLCIIHAHKPKQVKAVVCVPF